MEEDGDGAAVAIPRISGTRTLQFMVRDGGEGEYQLSFDVPPGAPRDAVLRALAEVYLAEGLPEWRCAGFLATAAATLDEATACEAKSAGALTLREMLAQHSPDDIRRCAVLFGQWADSAGLAGSVPHPEGPFTAKSAAEECSDGRMLDLFCECMCYGGGAQERVLQALNASRAEGLRRSGERAAAREQQAQENEQEIEAVLLRSAFMPEAEVRKQMDALAARHREASKAASAEFRRAAAKLQEAERRALAALLRATQADERACTARERLAEAEGLPRARPRALAPRGSAGSAWSEALGGGAMSVDLVFLLGPPQARRAVQARVRQGSALDFLAGRPPLSAGQPRRAPMAAEVPRPPAAPTPPAARACSCSSPSAPRPRPGGRCGGRCADAGARDRFPPERCSC